MDHINMSRPGPCSAHWQVKPPLKNQPKTPKPKNTPTPNKNNPT